MARNEGRRVYDIPGFSFRKDGDEIVHKTFYRVAAKECNHNAHDAFRKLMHEAAEKRDWKK